MSTGNSREVALKLRVDTLGADGITKLEQDVRDLAAQGGEAAPIFNRLADEIARLGQNAQSLQGFEQIAREVNNLSLAAERSGTNALSLAQDLTKLNDASLIAADTEAKLRTELAAAAAASQLARDAIADKRNQTQHAQRDTDAYRESQRLLKIELTNAERAERDIAGALSEATAATKQATQAEKDHEKALTAAMKAADADARALAERNTELVASRSTLAAAGVSTEDLALANAQLVTELGLAAAEAESLGNSVQRLAAREEQLASIRAFEQQANDAKNLVKAGEYVRFWEDSLQQAELQSERTAAAAKQSAQTISNAFTAVGTKDVAGLQGEIARVREAMTTLSTTAGLTGGELDRAMRAGSLRIKELERDVREATGQLTMMDRVSSGLKSTLGQFTAAIGIVGAVQLLGTAFVETNKKMEGLRLGLNAVYKDSDLTAKQIEFLRKTANTAGTSFSSITDSFLKFSASTKSANIPLEQTNALFAAVTRAAGSLGLSGDKVSHILDALSQMASKGTVSMEELRQQLGDSLPGALSLTAKGLGITDQELVKLVESGGLLARDLFPALTASLQSMSGEVNTVSATWERFKNVLSQMSTDAGDTGVWDALRIALATLGVVVSGLGAGLGLLVDTMFTFGKVAEAVGRRDLTAAGKAFDDFTDRQTKAGERLVANTKLLYGVSDAASASVPAQQKLTTAVEKTAQATTAAAGEAKAHTAVLQTNAGSANTAATAHTNLASAQTQVVTQSNATATSIVQLGVAYATSSKALENAVQVAEKAVKAREIEGHSMSELAKLTGNEREALSAASVAAEGNLQAMESLSKARDAEAEALRKYIERLKEEVVLHGDPDGARKKDIEKREQALALLDAEALKIKRNVDVLKTEVEVRKVTRTAYEDNSKSLDLLHTAMENTQETLRGYIALEREGYTTTEQVSAARLRAASATALYRDALADSNLASQRTVDAIRNKNIVSQAEIGLTAERARSLESLAKETRNEALATEASIAQKNAEISQRRGAAAALAAESTEIIRNADQQREALKASGNWSEAKEGEYQKTRAAAEAKRIESETIKESTKSLERQVTAIRDAAAGQQDYSARIDTTTGAIRMQNKALEELYNRNRVISDPKTTADGFAKNADGSAAGQFNNTLGMDQAARLRDFGSKGMTQEEIKTAIAQATNVFQDMQAFVKLNPGAASADYIQSVQAMMNAANVAKTQINPGMITPNAPSARPGTAPSVVSSGTNHTVTVQIAGGGSTAINVASPADGTALVNLMKSLETAARSSA